MTFFLMKNRFQQAAKEGAEEGAEAPAQQPKYAFAAGGASLLSALFGSPKPSSSGTKSPRKTSSADSVSVVSRTSSTQSTAFPPKRISFDEDDFRGGTDDARNNQQGVDAAAAPRRTSTWRNNYADNRPDDHSSGTTDPPDEDPSDALDGADDRTSTRSDHGSDTSGPDSSDEVQLDDDLVLFMRQFVEHIFQPSKVIDQTDKNKFGEDARTESGRIWFARFINSQRINYSSKVDEGTFYRLVQYCAIVLFECYQEEDYGPAKILMNICFTFYKEVPQGSARRLRREFLYHHLRKQAIWHSLKFWNAAYFDAMQAERARRAQREQWDHNQDDRNQEQPRSSSGETRPDEFVSRTLSDFVGNMRAFHVSKDSVGEFIRKQSHSISPDQYRKLRDQLDVMYR